MVGDPGHPLDHRGDAGQGPVVAVEAVDADALPERLPDSGKLQVGQARACPVGPALRNASSPPARQQACQRLAFCRGDTEVAGDLGLGAAGGEQLASL
jgi:hypothetical protein